MGIVGIKGIYPLVNVYKKTTERSTIFQWENTRNVDWAMFKSYVTNHQRFDGVIARWFWIVDELYDGTLESHG